MGMHLPQWVVYALGALVAFFFVGYPFKFVAKENPYLVSVVLYAAATVLSIIMWRVMPGEKTFSDSTSILVAIIIGMASLTGTVFSLRSITTAPNQGYTQAIYSAYRALVVIASWLFLGSHLGIQQFAGILIILAGLFLIIK